MKRVMIAICFAALGGCVRPAETAPAVRSPPAPLESAAAPDAGTAASTAPDAAAKAPGGTDAPERPQTFTLLVGGDVTLGYHYEEWFDEQVQRGRSREEMFAYGFKEVVSAVEGSDLFLVNLECPFTDRGEKIPKNFNFRARPEFVASLVYGKVGAVSLANNHAMDYGAVGLMDTVAALEQAKIPHFGAGMSLAQARKPLVIERNGIKIAFLGYFFLGDHNIEPKEVHATESTPGVAGHYSDPAEMERQLREDIPAAKAEADLVVPFFHWGRENVFTVQEYQPRLAQVAVEAGAAAVIGSHPHVLQGMELKGAVPVIYSLGNFVFGGNWNPRVKQSALVRLKFSSAGFLGAEILPMHTDRYPVRPMQPYFVEGEQAQSVLTNLAIYSAAFPKMLPPLEAPARPPGAL